MKETLAKARLADYGLYLALAILVVVASILSPAFLRWQNLTNIMAQTSPLLLVALGQLFVILVGGLDLSQASVMATAAVIVTQTTAGKSELLAPAIAVVLGFAAAVGLFNGWLVTRRGVPPFIATLGSMLVVQGIRFLLTAGAPKGLLPPAIIWLGQSRPFWSIPVSAWVAAAVAVATAVILKRTTYGCKLYATGGGRAAAELSGIRTERVITLAYVLSSVFSALGGLVLAGFVGMVDNWVGKGYELDAIAAVVLGGVALEGGRGGVAGALVGVLIIRLLLNLVFILHLSIEVQEIVKGLVLIGAGALYARRVIG